MTEIRYTKLLETLPATVPFVGPETQERARGDAAALRTLANASKAFENNPELLDLKKQISDLQKEVGKKYAFKDFIKGNSPAMKAVFELMEKALKTNINVSIFGEILNYGHAFYENSLICFSREDTD